jgi:uncharacterized protein (DUF1697 family)
MRYAAFLARINVGPNQLKMAALRTVLGEAGYANVETVTASGNVLFEHTGETEVGLADDMAALIEAKFGISTFAIVRSRDEVEAAIIANPFHGAREDRFVHTYLVDGQIEPGAFLTLMTDHKGPERIASGDHAVFIDYVEGAGNSKLTAPFIERRIMRRGTGRNLNSLKRILAAMDKQ